MFNRYIIQKVLLRTIYVCVVLTGLFWLISSVRFIEIIIHRRKGVMDFIYLMLFNSVEIIIILLPISITIAIMMVFFQMQKDRELIALRSFGKSLVDIVKPVAISGGLVTLFLYFLNIYVKPVATTAYRDKLHEVENSFSSSLIRPREFMKIDDNVIYVDKRYPGGGLENVLIKTMEDNRENIYYAKKAVIVNDANRINIVLNNGMRQWINKFTGKVDVLYFDKLKTPIGKVSNLGDRNIKLGELSLYQLLLRGNKNNNVEMMRSIVELYNRVITPLLAVVFSIVGICVFLRMRVVSGFSTGSSVSFSFLSVILTHTFTQYGLNVMASLVEYVFIIPILLALVCAICIWLVYDDSSLLGRGVLGTEPSGRRVT